MTNNDHPVAYKSITTIKRCSHADPNQLPAVFPGRTDSYLFHL